MMNKYEKISTTKPERGDLFAEGLEYLRSLLCFAYFQHLTTTWKLCQPIPSISQSQRFKRGRSRDPQAHMTRGTTWLRPRADQLSATVPGRLTSSCCWCWRAGRRGAKRPGPGKALRPSRARAAAERPSGPGAMAARRPHSATPGRLTPRAWA